MFDTFDKSTDFLKVFVLSKYSFKFKQVALFLVESRGFLLATL